MNINFFNILLKVIKYGRQIFMLQIHGHIFPKFMIFYFQVQSLSWRCLNWWVKKNCLGKENVQLAINVSLKTGEFNFWVEIINILLIFSVTTIFNFYIYSDLLFTGVQYLGKSVKRSWSRIFCQTFSQHR